mmetsp:Transcript_27410/g.45691  ORF Transcript_27410/g.45691 Transcript_27410/m.45691 type:complete len:168 (-) Transcript_27410:630-1133(-)
MVFAKTMTAFITNCICLTIASSVEETYQLPAPVVSASYADVDVAVNASGYYTDCVDKVNALRKTKGLHALTRRTSDEKCVDGNAQYDNSHGAHAHFTSGSHCGGNGECECPGWPSGSVTKCMDQMWAEGPPPKGGYNHYSIMTKAETSVACGEYCANGKCVFTMDYL